MIPPKTLPFAYNDKRSYSDLPSLSISVSKGKENYDREKWILESTGLTMSEAKEGIMFLHKIMRGEFDE